MNQTTHPHTFVFIAGAGHGGWVWRRVTDRLNHAGHRTYAPSLTGLADRSHLMAKDISLQTHIQDVVNLFQWEDIDNAILVGHSYGGWVVSGAAEQLEGRLKGLAFVDAFVPQDGDRGMGLVTDIQRDSIVAALNRGEASRPGPTSAALKVQNTSDAAWVDSKITPQPIGVSLDPVRLTGARERVAKKLYVRTPLFPSVRFDEALAACQQDPSWRTAILHDCGHDPMVDQPERLCQLLGGLM